MIPTDKIAEAIKNSFPEDKNHFDNHFISDVWTEAFLAGNKFTEEQIPDIINKFILYCWKNNLSIQDIIMSKGTELIDKFKKTIE